jgi:predicted dehydrogenase
MLYAHALEVVKSGELGDIKHIRALWHRNNAWPLLDEKGNPKLDAQGRPRIRDGWQPDIKDEDRLSPEDLMNYGKFKKMEELVRWRLYNETGGGLMAELGSHQLDACSIFLGKVHPLAVTGVGGKYFYRDDREIEDHVFVTFEFPGKNYYKGDESESPKERQERGEIKDKDDKVIVTYSSISTNTLEPYGECVMGSRASMLVENEATVMLIPERNPNAALQSAKPTTLSVTTTGGGKPAIDSSASTGALSAADAQAKGQQSLGTGPISKGYREEMEHFAYCVKMWNQGATKTDRPKPRCDGQAAMADAIVALTSNLAMRNQRRYTFDPQWFDYKNDSVPDKETKPRYVIEDI